MHTHQQNYWNDILYYWYQSYHWYQWTIRLTNRIRLCILEKCGGEQLRISRPHVRWWPFRDRLYWVLTSFSLSFSSCRSRSLCSPLSIPSAEFSSSKIICNLLAPLSLVFTCAWHFKYTFSYPIISAGTKETRSKEGKNNLRHRHKTGITR